MSLPLVSAALVAMTSVGAAALSAQEAAPEATPPVEAEDRSEDAGGEGGEPPISPMGALGRSLILPGWGQAELGKPIRGAGYFAAEAATVFMVFKSQAKLAAARRAQRESPDLTPGGVRGETLVDSRRQQREDWIVLSVFFALMSGVDAWVSAHLYDFEGELSPPEDGSAGVEFSYSVPLRIP